MPLSAVGLDLKFECFESADKEESKDGEADTAAEHFKFEILLDHKYPFS